MTTEEFTGHLLAALHGPGANEIVARIVEVAVADPGLQERVGSLLGELDSSVLDLEVLAHLDSLPKSTDARERVDQVMMVARHKQAAARVRRERLRAKLIRTEAGRKLAKQIRLDEGS